MSRLCPRALSLGFALVCGGCAHTPAPRVETVTVKVPIIAACVPASLPPAPAYADAHLPRGAEHLVDRYRLGASANEARKARLAVVEPVIAACR
jgi:hypothetical protein